MSSTKYYPQLDSLRALAALAVVMDHFFEGTWLIKLFPIGDLGIRFFFTLSGFLITGILLKGRKNFEQGGSSFTLFYHFYMRRFLRLFPIYYLYLLVVFIFIYGTLDSSIFFFAYIQNFIYYIQGGYGDYTQLLRHFWTLAVEEQFYILWPFVIIFTPHKYLQNILIGLIVFGIGYQGISAILGSSQFQISMMVFAHFDTLVVGSLLAYLVSFESKRVSLFAWCGAIFGFLLFVIVFLSKVLGWHSSWELLLGGLGAGLISILIINVCRLGLKGPLGTILDNPILIYIGRISYGIYVYHLLVFYVLDNYHISLPPLVIMELDLSNFVFYTFCSILVSAISWQLYELPLNRLKAKFVMSSAKTKSG